MRHVVFTMSVISLICTSSAFAAIPINLNHQSADFLRPMIASKLTSTTQSSVKEISRHVDFNQTTHIRIKQMYGNFPVWGTDSVVHIPRNTQATLSGMGKDTTMNGMVYQNLNLDLNNTPSYVFNTAQADKALQQAILLYQKKTGIHEVDVSHAKNNLMVYVDKNNKAHWSFFIAFLAASDDNMPALPTYIMDATSFDVYEEWNDIQTLTDVRAGGFGGNQKAGKFIYDGTSKNYPFLNMQRDTLKKICYLQNKGVTVLNDNHKPFFRDADVEKFQCDSVDPQHGNLYWDADQDAINGGFSPANDALYIGQVIKEMYQNWYNVPVLSQNGNPMMLKMNVHARQFGQPMDNAMFLSLNSEMYFGDGVTIFYPLTSLGVGAHEISHGFTAQHSKLTYKEQSGGLNESFSDMAAQAAEFYSRGRNSWKIGPEIIKGEGALRYMDDPTKDGKSIANMKDYRDSLNVHYTSGIFNKVFYIIGSAIIQGWNTQKAFDVMVKANMDYWTANTTFADAACGVVKATRDYQYDMMPVTHAFSEVGIDTTHC